MKTFAVVLAAALVAGASASCPSLCSGHGTCNSDDSCACWKGYQGYDCSQRSCPFVESWAADNGGDAHFYEECGGKGICDRSSGVCACFDGYEGRGCERSSCPNACSGHGVCRLISDLEDYVAGHAGGWSSYSWDEKAISACVCDGGYMGPDCSERYCPFGDDPMTVCEQGDVEQVQRLGFEITGTFGPTSTLADAELQNDQFAVRYTAPSGEVLYTKSISGAFGAADAAGAARTTVNSALGGYDAGCLDGATAAGVVAAGNFATVTAGTASQSTQAVVTTPVFATAGTPAQTFTYVDAAGDLVAVAIDAGNAGAGYSRGSIILPEGAGTETTYGLAKVTDVSSAGAVESVEIINAGAYHASAENSELFVSDNLVSYKTWGMTDPAYTMTAIGTLTVNAAGAVTAATGATAPTMTLGDEYANGFNRVYEIVNCGSGGQGAYGPVVDTVDAFASITDGGAGYVGTDTDCQAVPRGGGFAMYAVDDGAQDFDTTASASAAFTGVVASRGAGYTSGEKFQLAGVTAITAANEPILTVTGVDAVTGAITAWTVAAGAAAGLSASHAVVSTAVATRVEPTVDTDASGDISAIAATSSSFFYSGDSIAAASGTYTVGNSACDAATTVSTTDSSPAGVATSGVASALESLPNFHVKDVTTSHTAADYSAGASSISNYMAVTFNHVSSGNSFGAQALLSCPHPRTFATGTGTATTYGCGAAGCQPLVKQPRAVSYAVANNQGWQIATGSKLVDFSTRSVLTCPVGATSCTASATEHQASIRVLGVCSTAACTTVNIWVAAPLNSGEAAVVPIKGGGAALSSYFNTNALALKYAETALASQYVFYGKLGDYPADSDDSSKKSIDIGAIMADTQLVIDPTAATWATAANSKFAVEFELAFTSATCLAPVDITTSATLTDEVGFQNVDVENIECSGRGQCDRATGTCACFEGYHSNNCGAQTILI